MISIDGTLTVHAELCRGCRSCQLACSFTRTKEYNPTNSCIVIERDIKTEKTAPMIKALCCDLCGGAPACARACLYGAIVYEPPSASSAEEAL